jgi:hypothetical protein
MHFPKAFLLAEGSKPALNRVSIDRIAHDTGLVQFPRIRREPRKQTGSGKFSYFVLQICCAAGTMRSMYGSGIKIAAICFANAPKRNLFENTIGVKRRKSQLLLPDGHKAFSRVSKPLVVKPSINAEEMHLSQLMCLHEIGQHAVKCRQKDRIVRAALRDVNDQLSTIPAACLPGTLKRNGNILVPPNSE